LPEPPKIPSSTRMDPMLALVEAAPLIDPEPSTDPPMI
jgi:hypothetical protein